MKYSLAILGVFAVLALPARADCPPPGHSKAGLLELRQAGFETGDSERDVLALALLQCVGDPDPELRDGIAFEGLSAWLRGGSLSEGTRAALHRELTAFLTGEDDGDGFLKPFAALILSEVARTDRLEPWLSAESRAGLVATAAGYLAGVRDYRGFSDTEGWRHGVAHGADLALQLVLNGNVGPGQVERLLEAVAGQVAPPGAVFYTYGEPERLARPVFHAWRRGLLGEAFWQQWFTRLVGPGPLASWAEAWASNTGLARRHNTRAFLLAMYVNADALPDGEGEPLAALAAGALQAVR